MYRIMIAHFEHETNTFNEKPTELEDFHRHSWAVKNDLLRAAKGTSLGIGAFVDLLLKDPGYELIPAVYAAASSGGPVTEETFDTISKMITDTFEEENRKAPIDGILLELHGAQICGCSEDAEGLLLERLRALTGPSLPILCVLDFHANLTEKMVELSTALFPARLYPHTDLRERGTEAVELLKKILSGKCHPVAAMKRIRLIYPHMPTDEGHLKDMIPAMEKEAETDERVIFTGFVAGFTRADISIQGSAVYALTDGDRALAESLCEKYAADCYRHLEDFRMDLTDPAEAVRRAMTEPGLTVIADAADNPGSGLVGDATEIIHEALRQKAESVAVYAIYDPEVAEEARKAGPGATIHVKLGGKSSDRVGAPIECDAYVKSVSDGEYRVKGPMYHGIAVHTGLTAVLQFEGITCVVISVKRQNFDEEAFRSNGIEPLDYKCIILKSAVHYRSAWKKVSDRIFTVDMPNLTPLDETKITYENVPRPIYPLDSAEEVRNFIKKQEP